MVYDHARTVLVRQLRDANHGLSTGLKELDALEEAIRKAESELSEPERAQKNQEFVMAHGLIDRRTG